jgi:hypothetical protein
MTVGPNHFLQAESDQELETAAVIGAGAVQKLIADRNKLRTELEASKTAHEDLKRQLSLLHQRYIELGKTILSQLQQFDITMREAMSERAETSNEQAAAPGSKQFDGNGLPIAPAATNGMNGHQYGHGLPLEP